MIKNLKAIVSLTITFVFLSHLNVILVSCQDNDFDYTSHGDNWDGDCTDKDSNMQSPIILDQLISHPSNSLFIADFKLVLGDIQFLNTTIYISPDDQPFGQIYTKTVDNSTTRYKFTEIRFRSQSQHRIKDKQPFDLQLQIFGRQVYASSKNRKLAVGLLFEKGQQPDKLLAQVIKSYQANSTQTTVNVDLSYLLRKQNNVDFWYYLGSPTIPGCSNGKLHWLIPKKTFSMSQQQRVFFYNMFHNKTKGIDGNWRKTQRTENNTVNIYKAFTITDL